MASRFYGSCSPALSSLRLARRASAGSRLFGLQTTGLALLSGFLLLVPASAQILIRPTEPGDRVTIMPSDMAIFESGDMRKEIPCSVTQRKPELGFDLRFHTGYDVTLPLSEVAGDSGLLTVVFRIRSQADPNSPAYFVQHFNVPSVPDDAKGDALLEGEINLGEGAYHVDWLMRDRSERICSSSWDVEASLSQKDRPIDLFIPPNKVAQSTEPFVNDTEVRTTAPQDRAVNVKLLVNFAPQDTQSAALSRSDTDALVSILKTIQRDPRVGKVSLVAFNMAEARIVYRQETADQIDFPALGKALQTVKPGTVSVQHLSDQQSETNFLEGLIEREVASPAHPDAVIFAGPKAMLKADVPQEDLRRIGDVECPVFYMNYNLNPQAVPWKDSISHAIKAFRGTEYTISRPRDLWFSTSEMMSRILRTKRSRVAVSDISSGTH
jgi:hypothetical protein